VIAEPLIHALIQPLRAATLALRLGRLTMGEIVPAVSEAGLV
jgi:hypothetical protein